MEENRSAASDVRKEVDTSATPPDSTSGGPRLIGCILTKNEERNILRAVSSLRAATDVVVVVDSESQDGTRDLAHELGAEVLVRPFDTYAAQRNWAIRHIAERYGDVFIFFMDADEWLSDELAVELQSQAMTIGEDADLYAVRRRLRFDGRILRHGGFGGTWLTRLFPAASGRYEGRDVNEHIVVADGWRLGRLDGWLEHADVDSWTDYIEKHNRYSTLEARARVASALVEPTVTLRDVRRDRTLRKRWLRERLWNRLPGRPVVRFIQIYVLFGGFLDGRAGFRRALFESWQEMTTDLKAEELLRQ